GPARRRRRRPRVALPARRRLAAHHRRRPHGRRRLERLGMIETLAETDVLVVGSGAAGSTAAIAAARAGARTMLLDRYGFLCGTSTLVLDTFYGFYTPGSKSLKV